MLCKFVILAFAAASQEDADVATPQQNAPAVAPTPVPDSEETEEATNEVTPKNDPDTTENDEETSDATHEETVAGGSGKTTAVEDEIVKGLDGANKLANEKDTIDVSKIPGADETTAAPEDGAANVTVANNSTTIAPEGEGKAGDESSASAPAIFVAALVLFAL